MKRLLGLIILLACAAAAPSSRTHFYVVEYVKTVKGGVPTLNVVFYVPVTGEKAAGVLRRELGGAVEFEKPTEDVVATAWDGRGKAANEEDMIPIPGGSHLVYRAKGGKVETLK
jgi:hypothetical protein